MSFISDWGRRLARFLSNFQDVPASTVVPDQFQIFDGVDYSMPLPVRIPAGSSAADIESVREAAVKEAVSTYHFQFDSPYSTKENLNLYPIADPLREWDIATRVEILRRCHLAWERNPLANASVAFTTLFAVGNGLTVTYLNDAVEEVLEEFRKNENNAVDEYEKSLCNDLQLDGENLVRFFKNADGDTEIVPIKPWELLWIESDKDNPKRVINYHVRQEKTNGTPGDYEQNEEDIPAAEVLHKTINKKSYEQRGRPELFRILPWLKAYKDWLENRARQNHWRGSLLWWIKLIGGTGQQVLNKRAQYKQPPSPGSLIITNDKEEWSAVENRSNANDVSEDGRQIKMMIAVGARKPEYMLSDGANANLASSTSQQLPALRSFSEFQDLQVELWTAIYRRVIENKIASGVLSEEVEEQDQEGSAVREEINPKRRRIEEPPDPNEPTLPKQGPVKKIKAIEAFVVSGPDLESADIKNLADALQIAVNNEWVSNGTAAQQMGFDYRIEQKKIKRELVQQRDEAYQGLRPTSPFDPMNQQNGDNQNGGQQNGNSQGTGSQSNKQPASG